MVFGANTVVLRANTVVFWANTVGFGESTVKQTKQTNNRFIQGHVAIQWHQSTAKFDHSQSSRWNCV